MTTSLSYIGWYYSVLNGIAGLDCRHGSIQKVLRSIASEMLSADFELPNCDAQTARLLKRTYEQLLLRCPDLSADTGIASFMAAVNKTLYRKTELAAPLVASPFAQQPYQDVALCQQYRHLQDITSNATIPTVAILAQVLLEAMQVRLHGQVAAISGRDGAVRGPAWCPLSGWRIQAAGPGWYLARHPARC